MGWDSGVSVGHYPDRIAGVLGQSLQDLDLAVATRCSLGAVDQLDLEFRVLVLQLTNGRAGVAVSDPRANQNLEFRVVLGRVRSEKVGKFAPCSHRRLE
jgi:hypothetical protein